MAVFRSVGKIPDVIDWLMIAVSGLLISCFIFFSKTVEMPSDPKLVLFLRLSIIFIISCVLTGLNFSTVSAGLFRYCSKLSLGCSDILEASSGPTFTKYLLNS